MPYLSKDYIFKVQDQSNFVDIISDFVELKPRGSQLTGLSPFVEEKTPSFQVSEKKQIWRDFASDNGGSGAVSFLMAKGKTYPEAIEYIGQKIGLPPEYDNSEKALAYIERKTKNESLRKVLNATQVHYEKSFWGLPENHPAKIEVFVRRQYTEDQAKEYGIGFASGDKFISDKLLKSNLIQEGEALALINKKGYDRYWQRVTYPIYTPKGQLSGIAGRDISQKEGSAKWINSSSTDLYDKSRIYYGLHRASQEIRNTNTAYIVEGYNDVIGMHLQGFTNTIAPCGTSITVEQIKLLRKYCETVHLTMDGDRAGIKSALKHIPLFLDAGFRVYVNELPSGEDPDTLSRKNIYPQSVIETKKEISSFKEYIESFEKDGFGLLMREILVGDEVSKVRKGHGLAKVLASIDDLSMVGIYTKWLAKEIGMTVTQIKKVVDTFRKEAATEKEATQKDRIQVITTELDLPKSVEATDEILKDIEKYDLFQANNRVWMRRGKDNYWFEEVSNFSVLIIQHMQDEKFPKKLVRIINTRNQEKIIDVPSGVFSSSEKFDITMSDHGNYLWDGNRQDMQKLRAMLYDRMGVGSMITELGWRNEGFWVWNNGFTIPEKGVFEIDENGVFKIDDACYYVPSANKIYLHNQNKFGPQKRLIIQNGKINFAKWSEMVYKVHRKVGMVGLIFSLASMHRDLIISKNIRMPLLFLYGPPGTGKDEIVDCCMRLYGEPQSALQIGSKLSTSKAQIRKFAQFQNIIVALSEYRPGDPKINELLKGLWDNVGYDFGTIESKYGTDNIPISSSVMITGNYYPDDDALITRIIPSEMKITEFTAEQRDWFNELKDINTKGVSHLTNDLLQLRPHWKEHFKKTHRRIFKETKENIGFDVPQDRMIQNIAVLLTTYKMLENKVTFPFSYIDLTKELFTQLESQCRRLKSASMLVKWWECFSACAGSDQDSLIHGREFEIKNGHLYFNLRNTYNKISLKWWSMYQETIPSRNKIAEEVQSSEGYIGVKTSHRMQFTNSSVYEFDCKHLPIAEDLMSTVQWKTGAKYDFNAPVTPPNEGTNDNGEELPLKNN